MFKDNKTKQFIYYVGTTRDKLDIYENLFNDVYPNQIGGTMSFQNLPKQVNSLNQDKLPTKINSSIIPQDITQNNLKIITNFKSR